MIFKNKLTLTFTILSFSLFTACSVIDLATVNETLDILTTDEEGGMSLSNEDVIAGLKEALSKGTDKAVSLASVEDGFFKNPLLFIAFPEEAQVVKDKVLEFGFEAQIEKFEMTLNRAAERATQEAAPIFLDAVKNMSIQDGFNILKGDDTAATDYLRSSTREQLIAKFAPTVQNAINEVQLTKYWEPIISKYNLATILTGGEEINPDLEAYVTNKAVDGLFVHIASEEQNIRENPGARVTDLLQKVFGSVDN